MKMAVRPVAVLLTNDVLGKEERSAGVCRFLRRQDYGAGNRRLSATERRHAAAGICVKYGSRHGF